MKKCPNCKVQHLDGVAECECGYNFEKKGKVTTAEIESARALKAVGVLLVVILIFAVSEFFGSVTKQRLREARTTSNIIDHSSIDDALFKITTDIAKTLPIRVDKETELMSAIYLNGYFYYVYRLVNTRRIDLDIQEFTNIIWPIMLQSVCEDEDTSLLRERGEYGVTAKYFDREMRPVTSITVQEKDCLRLP